MFSVSQQQWRDSVYSSVLAWPIPVLLRYASRPLGRPCFLPPRPSSWLRGPLEHLFSLSCSHSSLSFRGNFCNLNRWEWGERSVSSHIVWSARDLEKSLHLCPRNPVKLFGSTGCLALVHETKALWRYAWHTRSLWILLIADCMDANAVSQSSRRDTGSLLSLLLHSPNYPRILFFSPLSLKPILEWECREDKAPSKRPRKNNFRSPRTSSSNVFTWGGLQMAHLVWLNYTVPLGFRWGLPLDFFLDCVPHEESFLFSLPLYY